MKKKDGEKSQDKVLILGPSAEINKIIHEKSTEDIKILKRPNVIKDLKLRLISIRKKFYRINLPSRFKNLALHLVRLVAITHLFFGVLCAIMSFVTLWRLTLFLNIPVFYLFSWLFGCVVSVLLLIIIHLRNR